MIVAGSRTLSSRHTARLRAADIPLIADRCAGAEASDCLLPTLDLRRLGNAARVAAGQDPQALLRSAGAAGAPVRREVTRLGRFGAGSIGSIGPGVEAGKPVVWSCSPWSRAERGTGHRGCIHGADLSGADRGPGEGPSTRSLSTTQIIRLLLSVSGGSLPSCCADLGRQSQ